MPRVASCAVVLYVTVRLDAVGFFGRRGSRSSKQSACFILLREAYERWQITEHPAELGLGTVSPLL